jgi:hypothetical protein
MASPAVAVTAMLASLVVLVSGADKLKPSFELKGKPSSWESTWRNCNDDSDRQRGNSGGRVGAASNAVTVIDVVPSPGSFAGRTGHSGSMKFVVDIVGKQISAGSISRQVSYEGHSGAEENLELCEWQGLSLVHLSARTKPLWSLSRFASSLCGVMTIYLLKVPNVAHKKCLH